MAADSASADFGFRKQIACGERPILASQRTHNTAHAASQDLVYTAEKHRRGRGAAREGMRLENFPKRPLGVPQTVVSREFDA